MTLKYFFISTVVVVDYMAIYHKTLWLKAIDIRHSLAPSFWRSGTQSRLARRVRWAALRVSVGSGRLKVNHDGRNRFHHGFFTQLLAGSLSGPHTWASRLPPWKSSKRFIGLYPERARSKGEQGGAILPFMTESPESHMVTSSFVSFHKKQMTEASPHIKGCV